MDGGQQRDAADHAGQGVGETEPTGTAGIRLLGISFRVAIVDWLLERPSLFSTECELTTTTLSKTREIITLLQCL